MVKIASVELLKRNTARVCEFWKILAKYGLADWLKDIPLPGLKDQRNHVDGRIIANMSGGERLRLALTEMGTTYIKLGQMLSTRPDLIGDAAAAELAQLQSGTPADSAQKVRSLFELELGKTPEECFKSFDDTALASASIGQVHMAELVDGQKVVVKIQHEGIEPKVVSDLSILESLAELAQKHSKRLQSYDPVGVVSQFKRSLLRELDFNNERRNLEQFGRNFEKNSTVQFPKSFPDYSSKRILTMEFLPGITGSQPEKLGEAGVDLKSFAQRGANVFLEMIFRDGFYHADPHPGNLMLLEDGKVGVLDCGMTGQLSEKIREEFETLLLSVLTNDTDEILAVMQRLNAMPSNVARDILAADIDEFLADYGNRSLEDLNVSEALNSFTAIIRNHHILLPADVTMLIRTLILLEGTSRILDRQFSLAELLEPYCHKIVARRFSPKRLAKKMQRSYRDWDRFLSSLPSELNNTLSRIQAGSFDIQLAHRHLDPIVNRLVIGILTASLFLGSSLLWSMEAAPLYKGISIFGAVGYCLSSYLGARLFLAIHKSGSVDSVDKG
ncbi:MAG: phosphotransferase [Desulfuromusa sp.]|nr:phosphotransferase [Desulfuromusa sp.]